jgi:hypothetical protein
MKKIVGDSVDIPMKSVGDGEGILIGGLVDVTTGWGTNASGQQSSSHV